MPPLRRRPATTAEAKKLPTRRLPVGTPPLPTEEIRARSRASRRGSGDALDSHLQTLYPEGKTTSANHSAPSKEPASVTSTPARGSVTDLANMSKQPFQDRGSSLQSLADAKLQRQNERIRQAETALPSLTFPAATVSSSQEEKEQVCKLASPAESPGHASARTARYPDTARINASRACLDDLSHESRDSSRARTDSGTSYPHSSLDVCSNDATDLPDSSGFTVITGRRVKRAPIFLQDEKPEERQATVEAVADEREILEVFGNTLPSLAYIEQSVGNKNGQLQFVQHPNGDVSAHIWSVDRFQWENLGQFSNIRKKTEGQLAGNRLRGETGSQTLRQNTLAYFRTIAKQREADAMGLPFGPKEIQALMSNSHQTATLLGEGKASRKSLKQMTEEKMLPTSPSLSVTPTQPLAARRVYPPAVPYSQHLANSIFAQRPMASTSPRSSHQTTRSDDPFRQSADPPTTSFSERISGLALPMHSSERPRDSAPVVSGETSNAANTVTPRDSKALEESPAESPPPFNAIEFPRLLPYGQAQSAQDPSACSTSQLHRVSSGLEMPAKPESPSSRTRMREHLVKLGELAKERGAERGTSLYTARTVLHDPYREQSPQHYQPLEFTRSTSMSASSSSSKLSPKATRLASGLNLPLPSGCSMIPFESDGEAWRMPQGKDCSPFNPNDSVPDENEFSISSSRSYGCHESWSPYASQASDYARSPHSRGTTYDEELKNWWYGGKKFARQEELFQSIKSVQATPSRVPSTTVNGMIRPPSASFTFPADEAVAQHRGGLTPFNESLTRILIPVYENLAAYKEKPKDYWCQWVDAPQWAIDKSPTGNLSFYDDPTQWGRPPARVGRDLRYQTLPRREALPAGMLGPRATAGMAAYNWRPFGRAQSFSRDTIPVGPASQCGGAGGYAAMQRLATASARSSGPVFESRSGSGLGRHQR